MNMYTILVDPPVEINFDDVKEYSHNIDTDILTMNKIDGDTLTINGVIPEIYIGVAFAINDYFKNNHNTVKPITLCLHQLDETSTHKERLDRAKALESLGAMIDYK